MADYPLLYGHSSNGCKELRGIEEVADYIVKEGLQSDLMITTPFDLRLITTYGPYIDKINDYEYREKLLEVLIPKQLEMEQGMGSDEDYGMKVTQKGSCDKQL